MKTRIKQFESLFDCQVQTGLGPTVQEASGSNTVWYTDTVDRQRDGVQNGMFEHRRTGEYERNMLEFSHRGEESLAQKNESCLFMTSVWVRVYQTYQMTQTKNKTSAN